MKIQASRFYIFLLKSLYLTIISVTLFSCAAHGPAFTKVINYNEEDLALIYLYHYNDDQPYDERANFLYYNKDEVFRFSKLGYTYFTVKPGKHKFAIWDTIFFVPIESDVVNIEVEAGKTYYIKYTEDYIKSEYWTTGAMSGVSKINKSNIEQVSKDIGEREIVTMRYLEHSLDIEN